MLLDFCMACSLINIMYCLAYAATSTLLLLTMLIGLNIAHVYLPMLQAYLDFVGQGVWSCRAIPRRKGKLLKFTLVKTFHVLTGVWLSNHTDVFI